MTGHELVVGVQRALGDHQRDVVAAGGQAQLPGPAVRDEEHPLQPHPVVAGRHRHPVVVVPEEGRPLGTAAVDQRVVVGPRLSRPDRVPGGLAVGRGRVVVPVQVDAQARAARQPVHEGDPGVLPRPPDDRGAGVGAAVGPHRRQRAGRHHPDAGLHDRDPRSGGPQRRRLDQWLVERLRRGLDAAVGARDRQRAAHGRDVEDAVEGVGARGQQADRVDRRGRLGVDHHVEQRAAAGVPVVGGHRVPGAVEVDDGEGAALGQGDVRGGEAVLRGVRVDPDRDRRRGVGEHDGMRGPGLEVGSDRGPEPDAEHPDGGCGDEVSPMSSRHGSDTGTGHPVVGDGFLVRAAGDIVMCKHWSKWSARSTFRSPPSR